MLKRDFLRMLLVTLVFSMAVFINLPASLMSRIGLDPGAIKGTLLVLIFLGLLAYRALAVVMLTVVMALGANLPEELAGLWGIDQDVLFYGLIAMVLIPLYLRWRRDTHLW